MWDCSTVYGRTLMARTRGSDVCLFVQTSPSAVLYLFSYKHARNRDVSSAPKVPSSIRHSTSMHPAPCLSASFPAHHWTVLSSTVLHGDGRVSWPSMNI